jgi:predicted P-loop ATPase
MSGDGFQSQFASSEPVWFERSKDGPIASYRNALAALGGLDATFSYDEFRHRSFVHWRTFGDAPVEVGDFHAIALRKAIADRYNFDPQKDNVTDAIATLCHANRFDPIRDYLDGLQWDGRRRIDTWLTYYLGVDDAPIVRDFSRKTLLAGVRRIRQPGCKFDHVLVLEGEQGVGKSSALRILAGDAEYFTDQELIGLDAKAQQEGVAGKWIVELSELAGVRRTEVEKVKSFITRQVDRSRAAYARYTTDQPRRCIMIGTTNANEYLSDATGNRRFWPVKTTSIDLAALAADRDQLWAEAARAESTGETLDLDSDRYADARLAQAEREERDPWEDILRLLFVSPDLDGVQRIYSRTILGDELSIPIEKQTTAAAHRLARCMKRLGWEGPGLLPRRRTDSGDDDTKRARGYWRLEQ